MNAFKQVVRSFSILCFSFMVFQTLAQVNPNEFQVSDPIGNRLEETAEDPESSDGYYEWADELADLAENPINLNSGEIEQLEDLSLITEYQVNKIREYRLVHGDFKSIYELQFIDGLDIQTIQRILPYVTTDEAAAQKEPSSFPSLTKPRQKIVLTYARTIQKQKGYYPAHDGVSDQAEASAYVGSPDKVSIRYRFEMKPYLKFGFVFTKNPGESFFAVSLDSIIRQRLRDISRDPMELIAGYIQLKDIGILRSLCIGNFSIQGGQGLTLGNGSVFSGFNGITSVMKQGKGIKGSSSQSGTRNFSGIAASLGKNKISLTVFLSYKKIDTGNVTTDSSSGQILSFGSIRTTGIYRTSGEIAGKNMVKEIVYGGNFLYENRFLRIGLNVLRNSFDATMLKQNEPSFKYRFQGRSNFLTGTDFLFLYKSFQLYGEFSYSINGGYAWIAGLLFKPAPDIDLSLAYRDFQKEYQNQFGSGFGGTGRNADERGLYIGLAANLVNGWEISAYTDYCRYRWLSYGVDGPKNRLTYFGQLEKYLQGKSALVIRFTYRKQTVCNTDQFHYISRLENERNISLRVQFIFPVTSSFKLRSQVSWALYKRDDKAPDRGLNLVQEISYQPGNIPLTIWLRLSCFNTDSYESRIYTYENDLPYCYSIPALFYRGSNAYLMIRYKFNRGLDLWARYELTCYSNRNEIGSGSEAIEGNRKSGISFQIAYTF